MANITKRNVLDALNTVNFEKDIQVGEVVVTPDHIRDFIEKSIAQLDSKAVKAAERAAQNKSAGAEVKSKIKAVLSDTPMTVGEIVTALDDEEITSAKVIARASQMVKDGEIFKGEIKTEDKRKLVVYATSPVSAD